MRENITGRYYCEKCARRFDSPGDCPHCQDEALLDLSDDEVRIMLDEAADQAKTKRYSLILGLVLVFVAPLGLMLTGILGMLGGIALAGILAGGLTALLVRLFPSKKQPPIVTPEQLQTF